MSISITPREPFTPLGPHDGLAPLLHSLADNGICARGNMEGLNALCESLKVNSTLQSIKCASCRNLNPNCS